MTRPLFFSQDVHAPLQHHPRLHGQQLDQHHSLRSGLLRLVRGQLHEPDRPGDSGHGRQGESVPPDSRKLFETHRTFYDDSNHLASFQINYRNHIALNLATAHPHYDQQGNTYNMGTAIMGLGPPKYIIFKVPADASGAFVVLRFESRHRTLSRTFNVFDLSKSCSTETFFSLIAAIKLLSK